MSFRLVYQNTADVTIVNTGVDTTLLNGTAPLITPIAAHGFIIQGQGVSTTATSGNTYRMQIKLGSGPTILVDTGVGGLTYGVTGGPYAVWFRYLGVFRTTTTFLGAGGVWRQSSGLLLNWNNVSGGTNSETVVTVASTAGQALDVSYQWDSATLSTITVTNLGIWTF